MAPLLAVMNSKSCSQHQSNSFAKCGALIRDWAGRGTGLPDYEVDCGCWRVRSTKKCPSLWGFRGEHGEEGGDPGEHNIDYAVIKRTLPFQVLRSCLRLRLQTTWL
jgi:hypothetical protein